MYTCAQHMQSTVNQDEIFLLNFLRHTNKQTCIASSSIYKFIIPKITGNRLVCYEQNKIFYNSCSIIMNWFLTNLLLSGSCIKNVLKINFNVIFFRPWLEFLLYKGGFLQKILFYFNKIWLTTAYRLCQIGH